MYHYHVETPVDSRVYTLDSMEEMQTMLRMVTSYLINSLADDYNPELEPKGWPCVLGSNCVYEQMAEPN